MRSLYYSIFFWILIVQVYSQRSVMRHFDTKNGLPSNEVYKVMSDSKGYIWICTDAGLVKYNGNRFKQFNSANGLPDNTVFEVEEDKFGRIWYFCYNGKIGYISNDSVSVIDLGDKMEAFVNNGLITSIAFDDQNNLYIGRRNLESVSFLKISPPYSLDNITSVWDRQGISKGVSIHIIGNDFVFADSRRYKNGREFTITIHDGDKPIFDLKETLDQTLFTRIYRNKNLLYLIFGDRLFKFDLNKKEFKRKIFSTNLITATSVNVDTLLIGELHEGMAYYSEDLEPLNIEKELNGLTFTYAIKDYQGGTWISTLESGVYYIPKRSVFCMPLSATNNELIYSSQKLNDSALVIATDKGKIFKLDLYTDHRVELNTILNEGPIRAGTFYAFLPKSSNEVILRYEKKVYELDVASKKLRENSEEPNGLGLNSITTKNNTKVYRNLASVNTVEMINGKKIVKVHKSHDRLSSIAYDPGSERIILGGLRGLYEFNFQDSITSQDRKLNCRVEDVKIDIKGNTYVATRSHGLIIIANGKTDTISEKNGLISNICKTVTLDNDLIWVSTNKGISSIKYSPNGESVIHNYPLSAFIEPSSVSRVHVFGNKVVFYSGSTLYWFNKISGTSDPKLNINSIRVNEKNVTTDKLMNLKHDESTIKIEFEALLFDCGNDVAYRYRLTEKDQWTTTKETTINLSKLSSGEYKIEIEALNNEGEWISFKKPIMISIGKVIYQKTWFIILIILGLSGFVFLILRRRYIRILNEERIKSQLKINMYELETKVVKAQMNPHFIFNSLNSIQQFILASENENAYKYLTKFSKLVRKLLESTTTEDLTLEDEIDLLNRYIEIEGLRFEDSINYEMHIDPELKISALRIPHMIIQPFVENAIWHGLLHKKGERILKISFLYLDEKCLTCIVEDNGVGRLGKNEQLRGKKSLAIDFIKKRLDIINELRGPGCGFKIIDKQESTHSETGTIVIVRIPIMNA